MRIFNKVYRSIISLDNLFKAWDAFKRDKRNKPDVAKFERRLEEHIFRLYGELKASVYSHGSYEDFWISDPKPRHIFKATVRDRIMHHAVFAILYPLFEPTFIHASFSCRIDKGNHRGVAYLRDAVRKVSRNHTAPCFVLKCDIRKFFDSVDHQILLEIIRRRIKDTQALSLIEKIIGSYYLGVTERERERERALSRRGRAYPSATLPVSCSPTFI